MPFKPVEFEPAKFEPSTYTPIDQTKKEEDAGLFMKIIDLLQRGNYASANAAKHLVQGDIAGIPSAIGRGITGEDKTVYRDVLTEMGWSDEDDKKLSGLMPFLYSQTGDEWTKFKKGGFLDFGAKGFSGLVGDIFLDPTTYVSIGALGKLGKGEKGLKGLNKEAIEAMSVHLAKRTGKEIFDELIPYAAGKYGDDFVRTLSKKIVEKKGLPKEIAKTLSDHLVKRHAVTFFGHSVLPKFIDRPVVNAVGKSISALGNSPFGKAYHDLFTLGASNNRLRQSFLNITNMDAHTKQKFKHFVTRTQYLRNQMSKQSNSTFKKALRELGQMASPTEADVANIISKYGVDDVGQQMLTSIKNINDTWYRALAKEGVDLASDYFKKAPYNPYKQPKIMTEEAAKLWTVINDLDSRRLKHLKLGTKQHGKRVFKVTDDTDLHEITADWVFNVKQEDIADLLLDTGRTVDEQTVRELYLDYMRGQIEDAVNPDAIGKHLGKYGKKGIRVNLEDGTIRVTRYGNADSTVTEALDDLAEKFKARLDSWDIDESNMIMRDTLKDEAKYLLKSDDWGMRNAGKKLSKLSDDFKVFYDEAGVSVPARYLQVMEKVRNKTFLDDLVRKFGYDPEDVLTPEAMAKIGGDFPTKKHARYIAGSSKERVAKLDQFRKYLEETLPVDLKDLKVTKKKASRFVDDLYKETRKKYGQNATLEDALSILQDTVVKDVQDFEKPLYPLILSHLTAGGSAQVGKAAMVLKNKSAQFAPDLKKIMTEIANANPDNFNLLRFAELENAVRVLEKQGKRVGVYVPDDEWIKIYKESGIKGAKLKQLEELFEQGGQGTLDVAKLKNFYDDFPTISRNVRAYIVDKDALVEMNRVYSKISDYKEVSKIIGGYKKVYSFWKAHALLAPGYHFRNMIGNFTLNYLGGVVNPKAYYDAYSISKMAHKFYKGTLKGKALEKFTKSKIGNRTLKQIWDDMAREGVINRGFFASDLTHTLYDELPELGKRAGLMKQLGGLTGFSRRRGVLKWNEQMGHAIESNARIAHYLDKVGKGFSAKQAGQSVKKFLFDYADLTEFEKSIGKQVMPFYTFLRKNLPLQLEHMVKNPGKQALWGKLMRAAQGDTEMKAFLPEWMKEQGGIQVGYTAEGLPKYFPLQSYLPFADVGKLDNKAGGQQLLSMMNPLPKLLVESVLTPGRGHSFFYQKPLEAFEGETENLMGFLNMRKKYTNIARVFRVVNEIDRLVGVKSKNMSIGERLGRFITGARLYPFDETKERAYFKKNVEREIKRIRAMSKYKTPEEKKLLNEKINELNKELQNKFWTASQQRKRLKR